MGGTLLTMRDTFLTQGQYCQLLYECVALDCSGSWDIWMDEPAVLKPRPLWTGKQARPPPPRGCRGRLKGRLQGGLYP